MKTVIFLVPVLLFFFGCATTDLPPVGQMSGTFEQDEKQLWSDSREEREVLEKSGLVFEDPELEKYLYSVGDALQPASIMEKISFRFRILKDPRLNAFAFPDGVIYVHTGILASIENEAQLAVLLAHEMTHCTHRHGVRNRRTVKNTTAVYATLSTALGGIGIIGDATYILGQVGVVAAVTGYSRELETEADIVGFGLASKAGYRTEEAPKLFEHLKKEVEAEEIKEPFFFGSHPKLDERIENFERLMEGHRSHSSEGRKEERIYIEKIRRVLLANAPLDLKRGRFRSAQKQIEKYLSVDAENASAYCILGNIYRQENHPDKAVEYFQKSISINPTFPEAYKGAGMIYFKKKNTEQASYYLQRYLDLEPEAVDKKFIESYLEKMKRGEI